MSVPVVRIPTPPWAKRVEVYLHGMRLSDYERIQLERDRLLEAVHREVVTYLDSDQILEEGAFPDRELLTRHYYVARESYTQHVGPLWVQIGFSCHCLGRRLPDSSRDADYLGLDIWLRLDSQSSEFRAFRNADSSVI
jgi:hypothetical protein